MYHFLEIITVPVTLVQATFGQATLLRHKCFLGKQIWNPNIFDLKFILEAWNFFCSNFFKVEKQIVHKSLIWSKLSVPKMFWTKQTLNNQKKILDFGLS